jgi:hypothetical protein
MLIKKTLPAEMISGLSLGNHNMRTIDGVLGKIFSVGSAPRLHNVDPRLAEEFRCGVLTSGQRRDYGS